MRVLYLTTHLKREGPNKQLKYIVDNLESNVKPIILVFGSKHENDILFESLTAEVTYLNLTVLKSLTVGVVEALKLIKKNNIGLVQSSGFRVDLISFIISKLSKAKRIVVVRNLTLINWSCRGRLGYLLGKLHLFFIRSSDFKVSCSNGVYQHLNEHKISSTIICNGTHFTPNKLAEGISCNSKNFITVSSKLPGKNIEFLLQAFISTEYLKCCKLKVAGYVDTYLIDKYCSFSNIAFLGHVVDLPYVISQHDIFISASTHEGMPNAVLESLAACVPVVLSDIPSHCEIIGSPKRFIKTFRNNDPSSLEKVIKELSSDINLVTRNDFFSLLEEKFSIKKMSLKYSKFYESSLR